MYLQETIKHGLLYLRYYAHVVQGNYELTANYEFKTIFQKS